MQIRLLLVAMLASCLTFSACTPFVDETFTAKATKVVESGEQPDKHGVVCYTTRFRGEFSCVKVTEGKN